MRTSDDRISAEELEAILLELQRLTQGLAKAVRQMISQEAEITALHCILEQKGLATRQELDQAREQAAAQALPAGPADPGESEETLRLNASDAKWKM